MFLNVQDPDKEGVAAKPASLAQERKWYTDSSKRVSHVDDLKEIEIRYEGTKLTWIIGEPTDDLEAIESAINKIQSLKYGIPAFLSDYMAGENLNVSFRWAPPQIYLSVQLLSSILSRHNLDRLCNGQLQTWETG